MAKHGPKEEQRGRSDGHARPPSGEIDMDLLERLAGRIVARIGARTGQGERDG